MLTEGVAMGAYEEEEPILVENIFHLADMNAGERYDAAYTAQMDRP